jgi:hypothetical protein
MRLTRDRRRGPAAKAPAPSVRLAPGAEDNGLASMLADLVRQNLEAKPHKNGDFRTLACSVAIVAEDAEVALTLRFHLGTLTIHDGIVGIPDVTIRGSSDTILALSNLPLTTPLGLPFPGLRDKEGMKTVRSVMNAMTEGRFHIYGLAFHLPMLMRLTRVMSVNG